MPDSLKNNADNFKAAEGSKSAVERLVMPNLPGKATHFSVLGDQHTLCGISAEYTTTDPQEVDCVRCKQTMIYKRFVKV